MRLDQIKEDCKKRINRAMQNTSKDADRILDDSFNQFYAGGTPKFYKRTGTLPNATEIKGPTSLGNSIALEAGFNGENLHYQHPPGSYDGPQVLEATATGTSGVVGDPTYDDVALEKIINAAQNNFNSEFR